jgi:hypothetical protein
MVANDVLIFVFGSLVLGTFMVALRRGWLALSKYRGARLVTCPENRAFAAVHVDAFSAAAAAARGARDVHLKECSRWPERADCAQACVAQIEAHPEGSRVQTLVERWYAGKRCVYCKKPIRADGTLHRWLRHDPALLDDKSITVQCHEVSPETLPLRLPVSLAVCWNCHEAETFRRTYPELVTDRHGRARAS